VRGARVGREEISFSILIIQAMTLNGRLSRLSAIVRAACDLMRLMLGALVCETEPEIAARWLFCGAARVVQVHDLTVH
jgi:hypothetical protein